MCVCQYGKGRWQRSLLVTLAWCLLSKFLWSCGCLKVIRQKYKRRIGSLTFSNKNICYNNSLCLPLLDRVQGQSDGISSFPLGRPKTCSRDNRDFMFTEEGTDRKWTNKLMKQRRKEKHSWKQCLHFFISVWCVSHEKIILTFPTDQSDCSWRDEISKLNNLRFFGELTWDKCPSR